jgi:hypothetical protein
MMSSDREYKDIVTVDAKRKLDAGHEDDAPGYGFTYGGNLFILLAGSSIVRFDNRAP